MKAKRLGRGLSGLIKTTDKEEAAAPPARETRPPDEKPKAAKKRATARPKSDRGGGKATAGRPGDQGAAPSSGSSQVAHLPIDELARNPYQPRTLFDPVALAELADSVREHGILQPIVVRLGALGYEIVAGERRWRAAQEAGLKSVPALVRAATDEEMQTLALVENLQREDLNAMEKARALRAMMRNLALTQEAVASRVGKARATIANVLRLLELPKGVQELVESGALTGGHARALLRAKSAAERLRLAKRAIDEGWSVREIERRTSSTPAPTRAKPDRSEDPYVADLEERASRALGTKVALRPKGSGGSIQIAYHDAQDLDRLLQIFGA